MFKPSIYKPFVAYALANWVTAMSMSSAFVLSFTQAMGTRPKSGL